MELTGTGVWSPQLRHHEDRAAVAEAAAELEQLGYSALWIPGGAGGPVLDVVEDLLNATERVPVATGILNVWMHDPDEVADRWAELDGTHDGRFLLGLGISHAPLVDQGDPGRYRKPLAKMREYLGALDHADPPVPREARVLAALGPKMLELSRDRSAGAHPYLATPEHTRRAREILGEGPLLAPEQGVVVDDDLDRARATARSALERYMGLPNYVNNWRRLGFGEDDFADGGSDRLLDALFALGGADAARARIQEHVDAGADHVCIQVIAGDPARLPLEEWRALAPRAGG
jgi:probable F420-dependent oxidoreductase